MDLMAIFFSYLRQSQTLSNPQPRISNIHAGHQAQEASPAGSVRGLSSNPENLDGHVLLIPVQILAQPAR